MSRRVLLFAGHLCLVACAGDETEMAGDSAAGDALDGIAHADAGDAFEDAASDLPDGSASSGADGSEPSPLVCGAGDAAALAGCVDEDRLRADLAFVAQPRPVGSAHWQAVQDLCATRLDELGYEVERLPYGGGVNVVGTRRGAARPDELVVLSAHYDHIEAVDTQGRLCPGADDNGSGVGALLEAARILATRAHERTLVVACWDEEERGLLGSRAWAETAAGLGAQIVVGVVLETMAFTNDAPDSQSIPTGFGLFFEDAVAELERRGNRGDFIAAVGSESASVTMERLRSYGARSGAHVINLPLPEEFLQAVSLADLRRSDHAAFWDNGYPALMLTDTANFRNPNYHCLDGYDTVETLDFPFLARVTANVVGAVSEVLDDGAIPAAPGREAACDPTEQDCPGGQRCTLTVNAVHVWTPECVDVDGGAAIGEACTRPTDEAGLDTCAPGGYCALYGVAQGEDGSTQRQCLPLCAPGDPCPEGTACRRIASTPLFGVCAATCDPFAPACATGQLCGPLISMNHPGVTFHCVLGDAPAPLDAPCTRSEECAEGLGCAPGPGACRPWCSAAAPCASGTCTPFVQFAALPELGLCIAGE